MVSLLGLPYFGYKDKEVGLVVVLLLMRKK